MSTAGPELPPHLIAKRKRQEEEAQAAESTSPSPNPNSPTISPSNSDSKKRRRTLGPSLPPAPLSELPPSASTKSNNSDPDSSSSDDDFGPSPPTDHLSAAEIHRQQQALDDEAAAAASARKPQREEWMLIPPSADDWTARVDPTKLRNRKFNTGKGSKAPVPTGRGAGGEQHALWTETPEQKRQRLEDEVMGVKKPAQLGGPEKEAAGWREAESRETSRRIQEYNVSAVISHARVRAG